MSWYQQQPPPQPSNPAQPNTSPWAADDDAELGGPIMRRLSRHPIHFIGIGLAVVFGLVVVSKFINFSNDHQTKEAESALLAASGGQTGTGWSPPSTPPQQPPPQPQPQVLAQAKPDIPAVLSPPTRSGGGAIPNQHQSFALNVSATEVDPNHATGSPSEAKDTALGGLLKPTELSGYRATKMPHPGTTIEEGRVLACKQVQPLTSQIPGFITAKLVHDAWSYDGTRRLLEADSTLFGEIAHGLTEGQDRLFVLWRRITAPPPSGVRITLNSPAADELGESGLPGDVDHHTWQKIGGALMLSGIEAVLSGVSSGLSALIQNADRNQNNNNGLSNLNFYQFQGQGSSLASQLLSHTINIPDTLHRDQAMPCSVFVSGDLDFSNVYKLMRDQ